MPRNPYAPTRTVTSPSSSSQRSPFSSHAVARLARSNADSLSTGSDSGDATCSCATARPAPSPSVASTTPSPIAITTAITRAEFRIRVR